MRRIAGVVSLAVVLTLGGFHAASGPVSHVGQITEPAAASAAKGKGDGCRQMLRRAAFHRIARRVFSGTDRATEGERRALNRAIRCQRFPDSRANLREHRARYRHGHHRANYWRWQAEAIVPWLRGVLERIAACESGGDPKAIGGGGLYRGKYQFDLGTWASVGGSGDPAAASEFEQDVRAAALYRSRGAQPWPVCGV
jgi:hypothetical protein